MAAPPNAQLRGTKRFLADLDVLVRTAPDAFQGAIRASDIDAGDDQGTVQVTLVRAGTGEHVAALTLLLSDTSEYPDDHTFYAFSPDAPPTLLGAIESIPTLGALALADALAKTLHAIALALGLESAPPDADTDAEPIDEGDDDDDDDEEALAAFMSDDDDNDTMLGVSHSSHFSLRALQQDFVELVASPLRLAPGYLPLGPKSFALSISTPLSSLVQTIPPRALAAWDPQLLSTECTQHLTLLLGGMGGIYPALDADGTLLRAATDAGADLQFRVGLVRAAHKPSKTVAQDALRGYKMDSPEAQQPQQEAQKPPLNTREEWEVEMDRLKREQEELEAQDKLAKEEDCTPGTFDRFALSGALEAHMHNAFLRVLQLRIVFGLGWAGAERLFEEWVTCQTRASEVYERMEQELVAADKEEKQLAKFYSLPPDPLDSGQSGHINLPLVAFSYLLRRLILCPRFCLVCHTPIQSASEPLKPYVCARALCEYQYYTLNMGPSLEHELRSRPAIVDLLLSLTYVAAAEGMLDPLPLGLGLRVPRPGHAIYAPQPIGTSVAPTAAQQAALLALGEDGLVDFDQIGADYQRAAVVNLINLVPSVVDMKRYLEKQAREGEPFALVRDMDKNIPLAAWAIVRWCLGSCTAHIEELNSPEEQVKNIDPAYKQYRFSIGSPDLEARFQKALQAAQAQDAHTRNYPVLYAFHGSPLRNWHSIIRNGLWAKYVAHGRAYGNGVYFALDGMVSVGSYATASSSSWRNSGCIPSTAAVLAEIVNLPSQFISRSPYLVVAQTEWIRWSDSRYLLVRQLGSWNSIHNPYAASTSAPPALVAPEALLNVPYVRLDPTFRLTLGSKPIAIPEPDHKLSCIVDMLVSTKTDFVYDADDQQVFDHQAGAGKVVEVSDVHKGKGHGMAATSAEASDEGDEDDYDESWAFEDDNGDTSSTVPIASTGKAPGTLPPLDPLLSPPILAQRIDDDWVHDPAWVRTCIAHRMPAPVEAAPLATKTLQRELRALLREQAAAPSLRELGWYISPEIVEENENLFQWIVELHSFNESLPIARDLKAKSINSLVFEIRFPSTFPHAPPFFRILQPRFLPFIQGGGGHVTGGGSMCMELLTRDGWLPSFSISSVLLQIKFAISNLEPRPARLAPDWQKPYGAQEALEGFKRAAGAHGWTVPDGIDRLIR